MQGFGRRRRLLGGVPRDEVLLPVRVRARVRVRVRVRVRDRVRG